GSDFWQFRASATHHVRKERLKLLMAAGVQQSQTAGNARTRSYVKKAELNSNERRDRAAAVQKPEAHEGIVDAIAFLASRRTSYKSNGGAWLHATGRGD